MTLLDQRERDSLIEADDGLSSFQRAIEAAVQSGAIDTEAAERLRKTATEAADRFNSALPPQIDPSVTDEIRRRLLAIVALQPSDRLPLDIADDVLIEAEAVRHIVRDLLHEQPEIELRSARASIETLESWLPHLSVGQLSELVGVSTRQLQRLRQGDRESNHRLELVVRLVAILRHAWTDEGVFAWFHRPRQELGGLAPIELLDDASNERALMLTARGGRVQVAS